MTFATTEVELVSTQRALKIYQDEWKDAIADFTGFVKKKATAEVNRMEPFQFLNDRDMLL